MASNATLGPSNPCCSHWIDWPSSSRNGTRRTCIGHLAQGQVRYAIDWPGLTPEEIAEGCVLPCVAYPASDVVLEGSSI